MFQPQHTYYCTDVTVRSDCTTKAQQYIADRIKEVFDNSLISEDMLPAMMQRLRKELDEWLTLNPRSKDIAINLSERLYLQGDTLRFLSAGGTQMLRLQAVRKFYFKDV
jgi:hypothetical protein